VLRSFVFLSRVALRPFEPSCFKALKSCTQLAESGVVPKLDLRFDVEGSTLVNATLTEVLHWAYERYVLQRPTAAQPHPAPAIAVRDKPKTE
jgi:hypothetical protein